VYFYSDCNNGSVSQLLSLRDRKRAETWAALHLSAAGTALDKGLECVTVDAVAADAGVSPRTFFNYFASKEDAVLGLQEPFVDESMLADFDVDGDLLASVSHLMHAVTRTIHGSADEDGNRCREVICRYPQLMHRRFQYIVKVEQLVTDAVAEKLAQSSRWATAPAGYNVEDVAKMLVLVAGAGLRFAIQKTISHPTRESQSEALDQGMELMRNILKELL
jgi:AcrR family transcriptional regulator